MESIEDYTPKSPIHKTKESIQKLAKTYPWDFTWNRAVWIKYVQRRAVIYLRSRSFLILSVCTFPWSWSKRFAVGAKAPFLWTWALFCAKLRALTGYSLCQYKASILPLHIKVLKSWCEFNPLFCELEGSKRLFLCASTRPLFLCVSTRPQYFLCTLKYWSCDVNLSQLHILKIFLNTH